MPIAETMWDVLVSQDARSLEYGQLREILAGAIAKRLPKHKTFLRVVAWSLNAGCLYQPVPGVNRYAVAYEVQLAA
jgi:hypothetical protein